MEAEMMEIHGFNKTTLLDYPEHVAATVFTGGCNFRCPFCQNGGLVLQPTEQPKVPEEEVFAHLMKRQGILEGLCITGGEPTLQPGLEEFIRKVKTLGYAVKLDTNGYRPETLRHLLEEGLLDYVAMDVKASKRKYTYMTGMSECGLGFELEKIEESVELLKSCGIPYEFRTTAVKGMHSVEEFEEIGKWLAGSRAYYLQNYQESGEILGRMHRANGSGADGRCTTVNSSGDGSCAANSFMESLFMENFSMENFFMESFSAEELQEILRLVRKYIPSAELRGVD